MTSDTGLGDISLTLVGAGKMGGAMLQGWLKLGLNAERVAVVEPFPSESLKALCAATGATLNGAPTLHDIVVLATKPQMLDAAAQTLSAWVGPETLVISVLAGKTIANIRARLPLAKALVRAMPNTPAAVGRGITGVYATEAVSPQQRDVTTKLLSAIGQVEWVGTEAQIDMVTAVSGSGPAYVFYLTECLAKAGEAAGLPAELAARLARATVEGAGELMFQEPQTSPAQLRINVTSPGGTTAAALDVLMSEGGLEPLMEGAVAAAKRRAGALSG